MGFSLAIRWSVPRLLSYLQFHLQEKIKSGTIHPMVTLAIARRAGLPWLITGAVKSLAQGDQQIVDWISDDILRWATTTEVGVIAGMKEGLWRQRRMMAAVPNAHHTTKCSSDEQVKNHCESACQRSKFMGQIFRFRQSLDSHDHSFSGIKTPYSRFILSPPPSHARIKTRTRR